MTHSDGGKQWNKTEKEFKNYLLSSVVDQPSTGRDKMVLQ